MAGIGNVQIIYSAGFSSTPSDLQMATNKLVSVAFSRKQRLDVRSSANPNAGTTTYASWAIPPDVERVIQKYKRLGVV